MQPGTTFEIYRVEELLGRGGMAEVYKVWNIRLQRHEALKLLPPQMTFDRHFVERFLHEARTAARLHHPHIATLYAVSDPDSQAPFFTMELVGGYDLACLIERQGRLSVSEALPILSQIADALDYAHSQGVVHRDVKPANVLLEERASGGWTVKMVDFGIALGQEAQGGARLTKTGMLVGTPEYMSPEQGGSGGVVDHHTDIYSLGVVAYEMFCGRPPFAAQEGSSGLSVIVSHIRDLPPPPLQWQPDLAPEVNSAILKALEKDPARRFETCTEFVRSLGCATEGPGSKTAPLQTSPTPAQASASIRPRRGLSWIPVAVGAAALLGLALIAAGVWRGAARVTIPRLVNLNEQQARMRSREKSLALDVSLSPSATVPEGYVISQTPAADARADPSSMVHVRISTGPEKVATPHLIGLTESEAVDTAKASPFKLAIRHRYSDTVSAERVISQSPEAGAAVVPATTIQVIVSMGSANVTVPDTVGLRLSQAREMLKAKSLTPETVRVQNAGVPAGLIFDESPSAGASVKRNTVVRVDVSTGAPIARPQLPSPPPGPPTLITSTKWLTEADLAGQTLWQVTLLNNEPYAKYGHSFIDPQIAAYFARQSWYIPRGTTTERAWDMMTPIERHNATLLRAYLNNRKKQGNP